MTNWDRWQLYCSGLSSPQSYVDWGFRYLIAASLQRRVWCPPDHARLYPNIYPIFVGKAGIGKGNVTRAVNKILQFHKLEEKTAAPKDMTPEEYSMAVAIRQLDMKNASEQVNGKVKDSIEKPLLIPVGSAATTYEALVQLMGRSYRRVNYSVFNETTQRQEMKIYGHSSLAFCLEEMGSLFRKHAESMVTFLQEAYDCTEQYEYRTKTQGIDRVLRPCLNLLAGTTPDFIEQVFKDGLIAQGFSSRAFFIFAQQNRCHTFFIPELTEEQKAAQLQLISHIKNLTELYGCVRLDNDTPKKLQDWWTTYQNTPSMRASSSPKLDYYYARKNIHVMKVAMAMHFGETCEMHIPWETFEKAMEVLHEEEKTMHLALANIGDNKLARLSKKIYNMLPATSDQVLIDMWEYGTEKDIQECLKYLLETNQIVLLKQKDPHTSVEVNVWFKKGQEPK